ncbi:hypothetical protein M409DRAFT_54178 [Zasmidium cellare ATCC 36951]|uniref:Methyltransferase domain-containing protein n=1 Tax=Zasmidium cellare ATCC 36951 TaxID=1080233 RepID=A0A6A6CQ44_ZASCE|nr:uncharacterized protein M409DRAFT_54178 [Zasmidium cellare ATCC 36951]KAF2167586.1 hypothetical protein M409DRAFT_54178 [Zasmidium cellare ATCC 36951]
MSSKEATFTSFTPEQAAAYAAARGKGYPQALYEGILKYHTGQLDKLLDVGSGPGTAVFDLLPHFAKGFGCDAGVEMIAQAKIVASRLGVDGRTEFAVCEAEKCDQAFPGEKVDLVTVGMAAHWFDMSKFYEAVGKVLKPGGTLAMWTCSSLYVHPSVPNYQDIQEILSDLEDKMLGPYATPGNMLSRNAYEELPLPWEIQGAECKFEKDSFQHQDGDRGGVPSSSPAPGKSFSPFVLNQKLQTLENLVAALGSTSMVIRWRQANSAKAHTEDDPINITVARLKKALHGQEVLVRSPSLTLLLTRRS